MERFVYVRIALTVTSEHKTDSTWERISYDSANWANWKTRRDDSWRELTTKSFVSMADTRQYVVSLIFCFYLHIHWIRIVFFFDFSTLFFLVSSCCVLIDIICSLVSTSPVYSVFFICGCVHMCVKYVDRSTRKTVTEQKNKKKKREEKENTKKFIYYQKNICSIR